MPFGLTEDQINEIRDVFVANGNIENVLLFGSRAKGNFKPGSDVDLALKGERVTIQDQLDILRKLDELNFPMKFDVIIYNQISDPDVIEHINRIGVSFFNT